MLLIREAVAGMGETMSPPALALRHPSAKPLGMAPWPAASEPKGVENSSGGGDSGGVWIAAGDLLARLHGEDEMNLAAGPGKIGGFSHESEHDELAMMVVDFLENGSSDTESRCSSDNESGFVDLSNLAAKISVSIPELVSEKKVNLDLAASSEQVRCNISDIKFHKHSMSRSESELLAIIRSLLLSINEMDLYFVDTSNCSFSCLRQTLTRQLRCSGYDAALCVSKWNGAEKVPGGCHEYIDVIIHVAGYSERLIIDIDFHSHFEIARAIESYDAILCSLPAVYVGSLPRLKQFLQVMVDAAKFSLKQNSMPMPPWRSLPYLQAKWLSKYDRLVSFEDHNLHTSGFDHKLCIGHLQRLKTSIVLEIELERLLKPIMNDKKRRVRSERPKASLFSL